MDPFLTYDESHKNKSLLFSLCRTIWSEGQGQNSKHLLAEQGHFFSFRKRKRKKRQLHSTFVSFNLTQSAYEWNQMEPKKVYFVPCVHAQGYKWTFLCIVPHREILNHFTCISQYAQCHVSKIYKSYILNSVFPSAYCKVYVTMFPPYGSDCCPYEQLCHPGSY